MYNNDHLLSMCLRNNKWELADGELPKTADNASKETRVARDWGYTFGFFRPEYEEGILSTNGSFIYNGQRDTAQAIWKEVMRDGGGRCGASQKLAGDCSAADRMHTLLSIHHLDAEGIAWWGGQADSVS